MRGSQPKLSAATDSQKYERRKERAKEQSSKQVAAGQEVGPIPPPEDLARRTRADNDFRFFCETYFPRLFALEWSKDHLKIIAKIEDAVIRGSLFAMAMPRGSGKTTLCQVAVVWAILTGRHRFVFLIAADASYAIQALDNIKSHLSTNDMLLKDFPEAIVPIRKLDGESRRCGGQRYYGVRTRISWSADEIVMPTIPGSRCSGAVIRVSGLLGNIRGAVHVLPDGSSVRPSLVVIDDPQTDASARSPSQVHERLRVVNGAILNLAGPGKRIAGLMPCTIIRHEDMAHQILDRSKHPDWQGECTRMVYSFPANESLWAEYARIRSDELMNDGDGSMATAFYRQNREAMDEGSEVAWPARYGRGELSAIQHAINLKLRDEAAFWAEYQNEPLPEETEGDSIVTADQIVKKVSGYTRGVVPATATRLTAFIDVQKPLLYWMVVAWEDFFTGYIVDYGAYPDQKRPYFTLRDARITLQTVHGGGGLESQIYAGLGALSERLLGRKWTRDDGLAMRIERCLIDANWGESTDVVYEFCRQSEHAAVLSPSHGKYVGASSTPFSQYKRRPGERVGYHWRMPIASGRPVRYVLIDTNHWKSFMHARLAVPMGDPGCVSLFKGVDHQMIAEQLTAEYPVKTESKGRVVDEWKARPGNPDNHWFDCFVGCGVAASMQGVRLAIEATGSPQRKRLRLSELQRHT